MINRNTEIKTIIYKISQHIPPRAVLHSGTLNVFIYLLLLLLLLLLKPAAQAQAGKTKLLINCLSNPTSTYTTDNRKTNSGTQPTIDCFLKPIKRSGVKHSVGKVIPHPSLGRQETPYKLGRSTP